MKLFMTPKEIDEEEKAARQIKLRPCPDCGKDVSVNAAACPHCGRKLKQEQTATGLLAAIIIAAIIGWILYNVITNIPM